MYTPAGFVSTSAPGWISVLSSSINPVLGLIALDAVSLRVKMRFRPADLPRVRPYAYERGDGAG